MDSQQRKNRIVFIIILLVVSLCVGIGYTTAYFTVKMTYDTTQSDNVTIMANVGVTFEDGDTLSLDNALPGDSVSKTFTVTNSSDSTALFSIHSTNSNTFSNDDTVYSLYEVEDDKETTLVSETVLAKEKFSSTMIIDCISIDKNTTKTYKFILTFKETNTDQSVNMGKKASVTLSFAGLSGTKCPRNISNLLSTTTSVDGVETTSLDGIVVDETDDKNIRYVGSNPNNYVWFNCEDYNNPTEDTCERWRIIGLMNNVSTDEGTQSLVKIVRASTIGEYARDNKENKSYSNTWETSTIKILLNDTYYNNGTSTQYYKSGYGATTVSTKTAIFDGTGDTKGITNTTKSLIQEVNWNVTSANGYLNTLAMYNTKGDTSKINIGLIDPSDLGFASSGESYSRQECLSLPLSEFGTGNCGKNSWLRYSNPTSSNLTGSSANYWTIREYLEVSICPLAVSNGEIDCYFDETTGISTGGSYMVLSGVRPSVYLKSYAVIQDVSGEDGSYNKPYVISIKST